MRIPYHCWSHSPYLGWTIAYNNRNWVAVYQNLWKNWRRWVMVARVLERTVATVQAREAMYKLVVKLVLFYGRKIWVVTG